MTEDKENTNRNLNKRKSFSTDNIENDDEIPIRKKVQKSDDLETFFENPIKRTSSGLTDSIKNHCKLREMLNPTENDDKNEENFDCNTPAKQIIPLEELKRLPIETGDGGGRMASVSDRNPLLNRSISEASGIQVPKSSLLNDSFEGDAPKQQPAVTPINFHFNPASGTPETPCELAEIDLELAQELPRTVRTFPTVAVVAGRVRPGCPAGVDVSPMFYPPETRLKRFGPANRIDLVDNIDESRAFLESEEVNKIEEIDIDSVARIIKDEFTSESLAFHTIDCRYPYEFRGGHIIGAVNAYTPWQLLRYVFQADFAANSLQEPAGDRLVAMRELVKSITTFKKPKSSWKHQAFVFHCEFSSVRAPQLAKCLRNMDRIVNVDCYPQLFFPKIYIMKNGYSAFYNKYKDLCDPQNYVPMLTEDNAEDLSCEDLELIKESVNSAGKSSQERISTNKISNEEQLKMYNFCKKESQEQMDIFTNLTKDSKMNEDK